MAMGIEGNSRDAATLGTGLVAIPIIKSGISGDMTGTKANRVHHLLLERVIVGNIVLVKGLGVLG